MIKSPILIMISVGFTVHMHTISCGDDLFTTGHHIFYHVGKGTLKGVGCHTYLMIT